MRGRLVFVVIVPLLGIVALVVATIAVCWDEPMDAGYLEADAAEEAKQRGLGVGPLRVSSANPRYFADGTGKAIYLTGSHTWNNFQNRSDSSHREFDYEDYLRLLREENHNFMRLWMWEQAAWAPWTTEKVRFHPMPYRRTGPGTALDGDPRFDLSQFNQEFFDQLRSRVSAAGDQGVYVAVMLFQGFSVEKKPNMPGNPWSGHPFHRENNINGIDGDLNADGEGGEIHTLQSPGITNLQEAYAREVVDTLNDLNNVVWEISNESTRESRDWQYYMIKFIKRYEADKPNQHPIGMTVAHPNGDNADLFESPADWISPCSSDRDDYKSDPPAANGSKVIVVDTDHLWGVGGDRSWVWKSFTRGLNPIFMDPIDDPKWESVRRAMGRTLAYANRMNLSAMTPHPDLASSGYCLANPGKEYLIYLPPDPYEAERGHFFSRLRDSTWYFRRLFRRTVRVDLSTVAGTFLMEWSDPSSGDVTKGRPANGGTRRLFRAPVRGDVVLYLKKKLTPEKEE